MDEQDLRKTLAKQLRLADIPSPLWQYLEEGGYIDDFWDDLDHGVSEREALDELSEKALRFLKFHQAMSAHEKALNHADEQTVSNPESSSELLDMDIDQYVIERNKAMAVYRQKLAEENEALRNFRTKVLDNKLLSPDQARLLLSSYAARLISYDDFQSLRV